MWFSLLCFCSNRLFLVVYGLEALVGSEKWKRVCSFRNTFLESLWVQLPDFRLYIKLIDGSQIL